MDETGLFFRKLPTRLKLAKDRVTAVLTVNATGTVKPKLWVIGKFKKPRSFGRTWTPKDVDVVYKNSKKAWMTGEIFNEYAVSMNALAGDKHRASGRKVLFLMDNASTHLLNPAGAQPYLCVQRSARFRNEPHYLGFSTEEHHFPHPAAGPGSDSSNQGSLSWASGAMGDLGGRACPPRAERA
eukprot:9499847-Pyramimonas_sp.AAC.1